MPQLWLTYQEIAQELECDGEQARAVAVAHGWARKHSSDGFTRVKMPSDLMHAYFARALRNVAINEQADTMVARLRGMLRQEAGGLPHPARVA